jgi:hypothetical protein
VIIQFCAQWQTARVAMDAEHIKALESFVRLHARRLPKPNGEVVAYLAMYAPVMSIETVLTPFTTEDVVRTLGTDNTTVRWLLDQMHSTDHFAFSILGLRFGDRNVLAHTLRRGATEPE